jgi:hypothetical protein
VPKRRGRDPQLAKTDPRCPICRRPLGSGVGTCGGIGTTTCYRLGYTRVSDLLVAATLKHKAYERKLTEILGQLPEDLEVDGG